KAQLKVIRHQGTPDETEQLYTVELKSKNSERIKLKLDKGRRTETAYVPPRESQQAPEPPAAVERPDKVRHQLRVLADPGGTGTSRGFNGAMTSTGQPVLPSQT